MYSIFVVDNEHQGSQCSSVPPYTLVVHNVALYRLGGAHDDFACSLSNLFGRVQCNVVSLSVCLSVNFFMLNRLTYDLDFWYETCP